MSACLNRVRALVADFARRRDGVVALLFALLLPVLLAFMLGLIDYTRASTTQLALQTNLDAAALYIARSTATTPADVQAMGERMMKANEANLKHGTATSYTFTMTQDQRVVATAAATVPVTIAGLLGTSQVPVAASAEVTRSSNNIEVGLALDITKSMEGQDLTDLKAAAKDLIDLVVKDQQTPYYSKVALVPYSMAVNVGTYANQIRGTPKKNCTTYGCERYTFDSTARDNKNKPVPVTLNVSTCVTERSGADAYTDTAPGTAPLGMNYPAPATEGNPCLSSTIVPLSSNRTTLKNTVGNFVAQGSTAGHIGLAWAWYMVSPNFASLWSGESKPAAYGTRELIKVVVMMTDGAFNTPYYNGVIASDAGSGSGSTKINHVAVNGSSFSQADKLCTSMKAAGVIVYTVGLGVGSDAQANAMLTKCATSSKHVYFPSSGSSLKDAFRAIGQDINSLRISK
ncbi:hypothetical protein DWF00_07495 [Bosea caraganae]|uniref:VWFA domain-containing protein n=1 Tax=Bosea caraganae TaxID=2763117 RepID=A0A370L0X2_9HYPH|nr:pilus assembly protein TadG-related protein [Bosea caraganae]RDJ21057.1 hypothetical protein DWE98_22290 [Bosea caraganae]RDJ28556.1 hypothetical protein DWF00_07495 [Bosea caraganae]